MPKPKLLDIPVIHDDRGSLSVVQWETMRFRINRVYILFDVRPLTTRGSHAHKSLEQLLIATSGSLEVELDDGQGWSHTFVLRDPSKALYIPPGFWRTLSSFSAGAVCLALASHEYDENDYIRDYDTFVEWKSE